MKRKKRVGLATKIFVAAFAIYAAYTLVSLQMTIREKQQEQDSLHDQLELQQLRNDELSDAVNGDNKEVFIEEIARESLDYVYPGEKVFVDISSN